jgi:hypothetical protein
MATRKVNLMLDEELVRRARQQDTSALGKSDVLVVIPHPERSTMSLRL